MYQFKGVTYVNTATNPKKILLIWKDLVKTWTLDISLQQPTCRYLIFGAESIALNYKYTYWSFLDND